MHRRKKHCLHLSKINAENMTLKKKLYNPASEQLREYITCIPLDYSSCLGEDKTLIT